jgi:hypothetical protein
MQSAYARSALALVLGTLAAGGQNAQRSAVVMICRWCVLQQRFALVRVALWGRPYTAADRCSAEAEGGGEHASAGANPRDAGRRIFPPAEQAARQQSTVRCRPSRHEPDRQARHRAGRSVLDGRVPTGCTRSDSRRERAA